MKKTKKSILILVLLLTVGFAAVTTTLYINGTLHLGANATDFETNVIFIKAELTYSDTTKTAVTTGLISEDGKTITFETDTLKSIDETATLTYDITNNSQYGASLSDMVCTVTNEAGTDVTEAVNNNTEYITLTPSALTGVLATKAVKENNTLVIKMRRSYAPTEEGKETTSYTVSCTIAAEGTTGS